MVTKASPWTKTRKGFKHQLVAALVEQGFSFREADQVIAAMLEAMKEALQRHESVQLPFGKLVVAKKPPTRRWRFGRVVVMNKKPKVVLECN